MKESDKSPKRDIVMNYQKIKLILSVSNIKTINYHF